MSQPILRTQGMTAARQFSYGSLLMVMVAWAVVALAQDRRSPGSPHNQLASQVCYDCHECAKPTASNPCLKNCLRPDRVRGVPGRSSAEYPDVIIMDEISELYGPVIFAHRYHAEMSEMGSGCAECHHNSPTGEYPKCQECHAVAVESLERPNIGQPGLKGAYHQQCLDCHIAWSNTTGCAFCHPTKELASAEEELSTKQSQFHLPQPLIKAEARYVYEMDYDDGPIVTFHHTDHVNMYGLECVDCHKGDACESCHNVGAVALMSDQPHEACETCHEGNDCIICHKSSIAPAFSHVSRTGWELGSQHTDLECSKCHGPTDAFQIPSSSCGKCHQSWDVDNFNHQVTGLSLNEEHSTFECESCHNDAAYDLSPTCDACHDDEIAYPDFLPGEVIR